MKNTIIIGNTSDNPFAIDVAHFCGQVVDVSDVIALKDFQNTEFCPRFINDEAAFEDIGYYLKGKTVVIVSTQSLTYSRNSLSMRNLVIARAAKDNGAEQVILMEPDLFYSCQDRGPRHEHSFFDEERSAEIRKKFDGQPFTALLYAQLLSLAGVDQAFTIHNHSFSTQNLFQKELNGYFHNYVPCDIFSHYLASSGIVDPGKTILCAPDKGAVPFVQMIKDEMSHLNPPILKMDKVRSGERAIEMEPSEDSDIGMEDIEGKDVIVFDDMVRTGTTIVKCCRILKQYKPRRIIFCVTHFHSSAESREKLADSSIDEIVTTNTIPAILNRDQQGRLRKKITVLKLENWIADKLNKIVTGKEIASSPGELYSVDISSKNPRWKQHISSAFGNK